MKTLQTLTRTILKFEDDVDGTEKAYVAVDSTSGGYPWGVTEPLEAHDFKSTVAARTYAKMFKTYPLKIKPEPIVIQITVQG